MTGRKTRKPKADPPSDADAGAEGTDESTESAAKTSKGHGRNGSEAYRGGTWIDVEHPSLTAGDDCPACEEGTVYDKAPGRAGPDHRPAAAGGEDLSA